jgi:Fe-S cluster assembly protein SufD
MAQQIDGKEWYLRSFEEGLNGKAESPIQGLRKEAIDLFAALGFPTTRDEDWKHTNVAPVLRTPYKPVAGCDANGVTASQLEPYTFEQAGLDAARFVFVNGFFSPELSSTGDLPEGLVAESLASAVDSHGETVCRHLAQHASYNDHAFRALNTAFVRDGAFVHIPEGRALDRPIHCVFVAAANGEPTVSHPRSLVVAEPGSNATVIESHVGLGDGPCFSNAVTEVVAGENAHVDHYKLTLAGPSFFQVATQQVHCGRNSNVSSQAITLGGRLVRNEANALLAGEGCEATIDGFYMLDGDQHVDNHTLIEHAEPHCSSHELYKGILDGNSRGVFRGKIYVHQKAQKTDAYQANRNLLLSDDAHINSKPQLEIYADDVKCSHGSTIGQLDSDSLFYLRSRGVGREMARRILVEAFAGDLIDRIRVEPLRAYLRSLVADRIEIGLRPGDAL